MIVLDTNVISEFMRGPHERSTAVVDWLQSMDPGAVSVSAISVAEIGVGVDLLPTGKRKQIMADAADRAFALFAGRILPFDQAAASLYPAMRQARKRVGLHHDHVFDLQIAAIARQRGFSVATRNVSDFAGLGVDLINPWDHPAP